MHPPIAVVPPFVRALGHGVYAIDTGFHREMFDACYLVVEKGRGAFIDTGTNSSVPRLLETIDAAGLTVDAIDFVIPTHVHLDHAGGVGLLMQHLPRARVVVHPLGARHLIDPTQLLNGARAVYGDEEMQRSYGDVVGVPADRVVRTHDGMRIDLAGRALEFLDTPGHARHHHCIWDERTRGFFTGDTFGISYREFDTAQGAWLMPSTTPVQFEPEALRQSVERMLERDPACMYLTHFGAIGDARPAGIRMLALMDRMVALALALPRDEHRHAALVLGFAGLYESSLREHGCTLSSNQIGSLLALDCELNAQGVGIWLDRRSRIRPSASSFNARG